MALLLMAAAALAAIGTPSTTDAVIQPQEDGIDVLALEKERNDRLTVPVSIGEHGPFPFLVDTGAQATVVSRELADRLNLNERQPATVVGMASSSVVDVAKVRDLSLGSRVYDIELAPLIERDNIGEADGILGVDSLQGQRVLLDFSARTISVADADRLGGNRGFDIVVRARNKLGQLIITEAVIDGIRTSVIIDTGAQGSVGNMALAKRLRGNDLGMGAVTDINGNSRSGQYRLISSLSMGKAKIANFAIVFTDAPPFKAMGLEKRPALILGMQEMELFKRVAIDFASSRILFDIPDSAHWRADFAEQHSNY